MNMHLTSAGKWSQPATCIQHDNTVLDVGVVQQQQRRPVQTQEVTALVLRLCAFIAPCEHTERLIDQESDQCLLHITTNSRQLPMSLRSAFLLHNCGAVLM